MESRKRISQEELEIIVSEHEDYLIGEASKDEIGRNEKNRANFEGANLSKLKFYDLPLDKISFKNANLEGAEFRHCHLTRTHFYEANLWHATFIDCVITDSNFCYTNLREVVFIDSFLNNSTLDNADITNTSFIDTDLKNASLKKVKLNFKANPENFFNVKAKEIKNNNLVRKWMINQSMIADYILYFPFRAKLWKWFTDYNRSYFKIIVVFLFFAICISFFIYIYLN